MINITTINNCCAYAYMQVDTASGCMSVRMLSSVLTHLLDAFLDGGCSQGARSLQRASIVVRPPGGAVDIHVVYAKGEGLRLQGVRDAAVQHADTCGEREGQQGAAVPAAWRHQDWFYSLLPECQTSSLDYALNNSQRVDNLKLYKSPSGIRGYANCGPLSTIMCKENPNLIRTISSSQLFINRIF